MMAMRFGALLVSCFASFGVADLRMASQPHVGYRLRNQGTIPWKISPHKFNPPGKLWYEHPNVELELPGDMFYRYMEPSTFNYKGLEHQKRRNYDNFLRSNIDNEQDNRNFNDEDGKDHLPFRTMEAAVYNNHWRLVRQFRIAQVPENTPVQKVVKPGESVLVPLRWNNPHASEMEVNIWIFDHAGEKPVVVPIRKPSCSGEGHQDNIVSFTVPKDFTTLGAKIPGFKGCSEDSMPMCSVQLYSHSVESRTYAIGFPIVIPGHDESLSTNGFRSIQQASKDPWLELSGLRDICLPATDPSATIITAKPRWARLVSDVYNHAYQNSDYSPYSGQQHEHISKNLQASAINKMEVGNRGELGKSILTREAHHRLRYLRKLEDRVYKNYEALANKIIITLGNKMSNTGNISVQELATCFRCKEVGSTNTHRQQTNTYIPSFMLPKSLVADARKLVPETYSKLITDTGLVQIYVAAMTDLLPFFYQGRHLGIMYQEAVVKSTASTMFDATKFKKRDAKNVVDHGRYAATMAKKAFVAARGCPSQCLYPEINSKDMAADRDWMRDGRLCDTRGSLSTNGVFDFRGSNATVAACRQQCQEKSDCVAWSIIVGQWCIGCKVPLHPAYAGAVAYKKVAEALLQENSGREGTAVCKGHGVQFGDRFIQIGEWRIGDVDGKHLTWAHKDGQTSHILTFAGRAHAGPRSDLTTWERAIGAPRGISFGDRFIQIGEFRIGDVDGTHFTVEHVQAKINAMICRSDGRIFGGPRKDYLNGARSIGKASGISIGKNFIQIGAFRLGDVDGVHFSLTAKARTCVIYRSDGRVFGGPRRDFSTWSRKVEEVCTGEIMQDTSFKGPSRHTWFCVPNLSKNYVKGPFADVSSAKEELNKSPGNNSNLQMVCEMTDEGAQADPHFVGGQLQKLPEFQTYWRSWRYIHRMNHLCNANLACRLNVQSEQIEGPLMSGTLATNLSGTCAPCAQFFGKEVKEPPMTGLASKVMKAGDGAEPENAVSNKDRPRDNPDNSQRAFSAIQSSNARRRRRRRSGSFIQKKSSDVKMQSSNKHRNRWESSSLEVLNDVTPLPASHP